MINKRSYLYVTKSNPSEYLYIGSRCRTVGILGACFTRSTLETLKKNHLSMYIPARAHKTEAIIRKAYVDFYKDTRNDASQYVRDMLKINPGTFAEHCCQIYKNCCNVIHGVAELYKQFKCSIETIRQLIINIPGQTEEAQACISAIISLPHAYRVPKPSGLLDTTYYDQV